MLPIIALSFVAVIALQYFGPKPSVSESPNSTNTPTSNSQNTSSTSNSANKDFRFRKAKGTRSIISTRNFHIFLSSQGARIERLYIKSNEDLPLPQKAAQTTRDAFAIDNHAPENSLEITRSQGMDFQPHLYYSGEYASQLGYPPLNEAAFSLVSEKHNEKLGTSEFHYSIALRFRKHRLKLDKIYRFYGEENYFRQITILTNLERRIFDLSFDLDGTKVYGSLFYKTFGDIGPVESKSSAAAGFSGRFFYYGDELIKRVNNYQSSGGGCFPFGCTSVDQNGTYTRYTSKPASLSFMGSNSRYFFAYADFLSLADPSRHTPDGFIYKNHSNPQSQFDETMTAVFLNIRLAPAQKQRILNLGSPNVSLGSKTNSNRIRVLQKERKDALIIDNKVFIGTRSRSSHAFRNPELMQADFGVNKANSEAEEAIYYSGYTALFSGIKDVIISIMRWLYGYIGNYGWCIIIIAIGFKFATFPLNQMQVKNMQRMSLMRPEIEAINLRYKDNPQERQKHTMQLFKKFNTNPAKGCLPLLIQMPIFVGLYSAFSSSIELWHSPFIFWLQDLSQPDTVAVIPFININLNLLPLLMVGSQILYQRYTSVATDPQQKMLMYIMPIMMLFFFWQIPSGVTLYWTVQNFISIAWQKASDLLGKDKQKA